MATILQPNPKTIQKKTNKISICNYCYYYMPKKHIVKCKTCGLIFCKHCLTTVGSDSYCHDCLVIFVRTEAKIIIS